MTAKLPTEETAEPVPGWPGWVYWHGEHGWPEAKRLHGGSEPVRIRARHWTALLAAIRKTEERRQR